MTKERVKYMYPEIEVEGFMLKALGSNQTVVSVCGH